MGVVDAAANLLAQMGGGNVFVIYTVIVWASVLFSAFIDNIPYVATMLPVVTGLAGTLALTRRCSTSGFCPRDARGNCTPIGASANITGIGILRRAGHEVKTSDFCRIGIPFTLAAIIPAYIYFWYCSGKLHSSKNYRPPPLHTGGGRRFIRFCAASHLVPPQSVTAPPVQFADDFDHFFMPKGSITCPSLRGG